MTAQYRSVDWSQSHRVWLKTLWVALALPVFFGSPTTHIPHRHWQSQWHPQHLVLVRETLARTREEVLTDRLESLGVVEIHMVLNANGFGTDGD